jgi:hypothetical protein
LEEIEEMLEDPNANEKEGMDFEADWVNAGMEEDPEQQEPGRQEGVVHGKHLLC